MFHKKTPLRLDCTLPQRQPAQRRKEIRCHDTTACQSAANSTAGTGVGDYGASTGFVHRLTDGQVADLPVETVPVPRGGAIFFHNLLLHASCPNINGQDRWSVIPTFRDPSLTDSSNVWRTALVLSGSSVNI
jgi:ectoine hydroxylase-related dioxygenase (phytanoyl-CoA dioxygenase family)